MSKPILSAIRRTLGWNSGAMRMTRIPRSDQSTAMSSGAFLLSSQMALSESGLPSAHSAYPNACGRMDSFATTFLTSMTQMPPFWSTPIMSGMPSLLPVRICR